MNGLVTRTVCNSKPVTGEYALTPYSEPLDEVIIAMHRYTNFFLFITAQK
ncbi:HxlR family transcriptional regulator [Spirosoma oryzae]|uniref:HxlR family transcriptional regulator n=2 Tax=Spirosoma oryzae TaxID=1469603 RepID=A0A2T0SAL0_9BACT|nr:HxlR family transcriptional regulator [Spirosoma oryzae]